MYKIVRTFLKHDQTQVIKSGLTLAQAQKHCRDPETSSSTCTDPKLIDLTGRVGPWFDGYDKQ